MTYSNFKERFSEFIIFSLLDIKKIEPEFDRRRLSEWQDKGYIQKIRRGYYIFSDLELTEEVLFLIANRLYTPSYISLEMALSYYGLIPEGVYQFTSVSTRLPKEFETPIANFNYRQVKQEYFFGYNLQKTGDQNYKIADIEKAVLDYLYLNPEMNNDASLSEWRFDFDVFREKADMEKFSTYLKNFDSPSLDSRAKKFIKYMEEQNDHS